MGVKTLSVIVPERQLPISKQESIRKAGFDKVAEIAQNDMPGLDITIRDLLPADINYTNQEFVEASGADNTWAALAGPDGTAIADERFIVVWGVGINDPLVIDNAGAASIAPISALRFTVGASLISQVSLSLLYSRSMGGTDAGETLPPVEIGYLLTPIAIRQNQTFKVEEYTTTATRNYSPVFVGAVAEKAGKTLAV